MIAKIDWKAKVVRGEADKKNYRHFENLYEFTVSLIWGLVSTSTKIGYLACI